MKVPASLQLRIAIIVSVVILAAALTAGFYISLELSEDNSPVGMALEYMELLALLVPFAVAAPIAAYLAARWSLRPLEQIERDAEAVTPQNPNHRLNLDRAPFEVHGLVDAVNCALDRMSEAYDHERQFTANAAHALRTPLSVMSLRLQQAIDNGQLDSVIYTEDMQRLGRVVEQLLALGRIDAHDFRSDKLVVDLSRIARAVAAELLPIAEANGRILQLDADNTHFAVSDEESVSLIVRNMVENALTHGSGTIRISTGSDHGEAWLCTADEGSGPKGEIRMNAFNRFVRSSSSKGSGLGLAIARDAARELGGDIAWEKGSLIRLKLPAVHQRP